MPPFIVFEKNFTMKTKASAAWLTTTDRLKNDYFLIGRVGFFAKRNSGGDLSSHSFWTKITCRKLISRKYE